MRLCTQLKLKAKSLAITLGGWLVTTAHLTRQTEMTKKEKNTGNSKMVNSA